MPAQQVCARLRPQVLGPIRSLPSSGALVTSYLFSSFLSFFEDLLSCSLYPQNPPSTATQYFHGTWQHGVLLVSDRVGLSLGPTHRFISQVLISTTNHVLPTANSSYLSPSASLSAVHTVGTHIIIVTKDRQVSCIVIGMLLASTLVLMQYGACSCSWFYHR